MGLVVVSPGLCSTVQDAGRPGYRAWGVPVAGAFDRGSYDLANALLGNRPGASALELTLVGGIYQARVPLAIALAGAPMEAAIEEPGGGRRVMKVPQTATLDAGGRLVLGGTGRGARTYLAVLGGWQTRLVMGSRSSEVRLRAGDVLPAEPGTTPVRRPADDRPPDRPEGPIRIIDGPDAVPGFDHGAWDDLTFRSGPLSDRMGLRLEGAAPEVEADPGRVSMPVAPGAVQVAGGRLIILGVACGTMGGYPQVAHVISADLGRLGQVRPGDPVRLRRITPEEARRIDRADRLERAERLLRVAALAADHWGN